MEKLRVFEAFSGYGSQSIALRNLGIQHEVVAISEIDKYAIQAYEAIHGEVNNLGDISKIKVEDIPQHDLFTYSFPCQDISVAGNTKGIVRGKTRSGLLYECERIIEHCKPKYLLLENVKNLVSKKFKPQFDEWLEYLESLGYTNYWKVLNAKDCGVPQNRERVFVVSILGEHEPYEFPKPIPLDKCIADILENEVDEKYYVNKQFHLVNKEQQSELDVKKHDCIKKNHGVDEGVLPILTTIESDNTESKILCAGNINPSGKGMNGNVFDSEGLSPTLTTNKGEGVKILVSQDSRKDCIEKVERIPLKFLNRNGKQTGSDYTFCVDTCHTGGIKETYNDNTYRIRRLTPKECFRLMGMKDSDIEKIQQSGISNAQQYKMAGNSIVVDVLEGIFKGLFI